MDPGSGRSSGNGDSGSERLSETQREVNFKKQHKEYIAMKLARKKEIIKRRKQQFGSSSSDEDDSDFVVSPSSPIQKRQSLQQPEKVKVEEPKKHISPEQLTQKLSIYLQNKKGGKWSQEMFQFQQKGKVSFSSLSYEVKRVDKIKLMVEMVNQNIYIIQLSFANAGQVTFGVSSLTKKVGLPLLYYVFSKLIQQKVATLGIKLTQNISEKIQGIPEAVVSKAFKYGKILKKSQVFGKWEQRLIVFNEKGLFSYKKQTEKYTMFIGKFTVNEVWTRFEVEAKMLVIKLKYGATKTEFGIPLSDYESVNSWLYHFYCLSIKTV